ncbi:coiled-coil domain-containing protein 142 [Spea bombifrons]|uniref:coiled-coil domain-containing protein 142 n=1 Tax=Spea bombifrons TaxID=233779 RepID=UPI0023495FF1|nr:coiled-coil domain-containing protein 142 [Spea bombifrons]
MRNQTEDGAGVASLSCSPVRLLLQSVESTFGGPDDLTDCPPETSDLQPGVSTHTPLDHVLSAIAQRNFPSPIPSAAQADRVSRLIRLTTQRHFLFLSRHLAVCLKGATDLINHLCARLDQGPLRPSEMGALCRRLRQQIRNMRTFQRTLREDRWPSPSSPALRRAVGQMQRVLALQCAQAARLTEQCILSVLRHVALSPSDASGELAQALSVYNHGVSELRAGAERCKGLSVFSTLRAMRLVAEQRGPALARLFCQGPHRPGLEAAVRDRFGRGVQWEAARLRLGPDAAPVGAEALGVLAETDRDQVTALLRILAQLDPALRASGWHADGGHGVSDAALCTQYSARLWPVFYAHVYPALYPGLRGRWQLPSLSACGEAAALPAVQNLQDTLTCVWLPERCRSEGRSLCLRLLSTCVFVAWDGGVCAALSAALTDKCVAHAAREESAGEESVAHATGEESAAHAAGEESAVRSRTAGLLAGLCRWLCLLLPGPDGAVEDVSLGRCVCTLQLCDLWLRSRSQLYVSAGALGQLAFLSYGDLPVLDRETDGLCAGISGSGSLKWRLSFRLYQRLQAARRGLEGLSLSLPHALGTSCERSARHVFQHLMPGARYWRGTFATDSVVSPGEYSLSAVRAVLVPVLDGVRMLPAEGQVGSLAVAVSSFMEAWMGHILREKLKFSLQGALRLRCDFESVRVLLRSPSAGLSPEVMEAVFFLPVFRQSDNAVICLLQQPSRRVCLRSAARPLLSCCPVLCGAAVDSVSDSLQSLESVERGAWGTQRSATQHSRSSYLPHNQQQWLSLRVRKGWSGASGLVEPDTSEG